jgi:hypothetical protein
MTLRTYLIRRMPLVGLLLAGGYAWALLLSIVRP